MFHNIADAAYRSEVLPDTQTQSRNSTSEIQPPPQQQQTGNFI